MAIEDEDRSMEPRSACGTKTGHMLLIIPTGASVILARATALNLPAVNYYPLVADDDCSIMACRHFRVELKLAMIDCLERWYSYLSRCNNKWLCAIIVNSQVIKLRPTCVCVCIYR